MTNCMGKHVADGSAFVKERSFMGLQILCSVEKDLHHLVCGQSVLHDSSFDIHRVISSRDGLLISWIHFAPDDDLPAAAVFGEVQPAN